MTETESDRVYRGGGWSGVPVYERIAYRNGYSPDVHRSSLGLRAVVDASTTDAPTTERERIARWLEREADTHAAAYERDGDAYHLRAARRIAALARGVRDGAPDADV